MLSEAPSSGARGTRAGEKAPMKPSEAERILSFLDGEMDAGKAAEFEAEAVRDPRTAEELAACRLLFESLRTMRPLRPAKGFATRVAAAWLLQTEGAGAGSRLFGRRPVARDPFGALADGALARRQTRALLAFAARDGEAAEALASSGRLLQRLAGLPGFRPSEGFSDRVASQAASSLRPAPAEESALARLRAVCWPRRGRRLAFASGLATGPAAALAATAYLVLSRPLATPSNVLAFAWAKTSAAASGLVDSVVATAAGSPLARGAYEALNGLGAWASAAAAGGVAVVALGLLSAWVLYKNIVTANGTGGTCASA